jgi:hypothetical protein
MADDFKIEISSFEPEDILKDIKDTKTKLNIIFPKEADNIFLLKSIILEQHNRISELERKVKSLEKQK